MRRSRGIRGRRGTGRGEGHQGPRFTAPSHVPVRATYVAGPSTLLSPPRLQTYVTSDERQREAMLHWLTASGSASASSSSVSQPQRSSSPSSLDLDTVIPAVGVSPNPYSEELFSATMCSDSQWPIITPEAEWDETLCSDAQQLIPVAELEEAGPSHEHVAASVASSPLLLSVEGMEEDRSEEEPYDDETADPTWADFDQPLSRASSADDGDNDDEVVSTPVRPQKGRGRSKKSTGTVSRVSAAAAAPAANTETTVSPSKRSRSTCEAWNFFKRASDSASDVICRLCRQRVSRGKNVKSLTTTSMNRHMALKHQIQWNRHLEQKGQPGAPGLPTAHTPTTSSSASSSAMLSSSVAPVPQEQTLPPDVVPFSPPVSPLSPSPSSVTYTPSSSQASVLHLWEHKKPFHPSHPKVKSLNVAISRLLAVEMLPFRLVDTVAFRHVMGLACPQYKMPSRHFFSRKAVPALATHVSENISRSLSASLAQKVHLTTDTWTSKHGQGRYISLTAHWVTLGGGRGERTSRTVSPSAGVVQPSDPITPRHATRHQAILKLMCLGDLAHTGTELWTALQNLIRVWLEKHNLSAGNVVCDNGKNLLAALRLGGLTHVPCLAHVLNLIVQKFLKCYPDMDPLLRKARGISAHFRRSHPASAKLSALLSDMGLPVLRLICDVPTRWNSTMYMLQRLCQQRHAITRYAMSSSGKDLPVLSPREWRQLMDLCTILGSFEEGTKMVSHESALVSMTILVIHLLEQTLLTLRQPGAAGGLEEEDEEPYQEEGEEEVYRGESRTGVVARGPDASQGSSAPQVEEEDEEAFLELHGSEQPSLLRGWHPLAEEEESAEEDEDNEEARPTASRPPGFGDHGSISHMSAWMLHYLQHDPRILAIKRNSDYWVATLLDPRYKTKMGNFIPPSEIDCRMGEYHEALIRQLEASFPPTETAVPQEPTQQVVQRQSGRRRGRTLLGDMWQSIFSTAAVTVRQDRSESQTHRDRLKAQVHEYHSMNIDACGLSLDPFCFWVSKMEQWPQLARYAVQVLSCPAASVISERTFSTAGGVITEKRIRLSPENVDRLTFVKMNQAWIAEDFVAPVADVTE